MYQGGIAYLCPVNNRRNDMTKITHIKTSAEFNKICVVRDIDKKMNLITHALDADTYKTGLYFDFKNNKIIATDNHQIAGITLVSDNDHKLRDVDLAVCLPIPIAHILQNNKGVTEFSAGTTNNTIYITGDNTELQCVPISIVLPNYMPFLVKAEGTVASRKRLIADLKEVSEIRKSAWIAADGRVLSMPVKDKNNEWIEIDPSRVIAALIKLHSDEVALKIGNYTPPEFYRSGLYIAIRPISSASEKGFTAVVAGMMRG
jgi:hypothetical protein